jgi:hypothetical protein
VSVCAAPQQVLSCRARVRPDSLFNLSGFAGFGDIGSDIQSRIDAIFGRASGGAGGRKLMEDEVGKSDDMMRPAGDVLLSAAA